MTPIQRAHLLGGLEGRECSDIDIAQRIVPGVSEFSYLACFEYQACFEPLPARVVALVQRLSAGAGWGRIRLSERGRAWRTGVVAILAGCAAGVATALNRHWARPADPAVPSIALRDRLGWAHRAMWAERHPSGAGHDVGGAHHAMWAELSRFGIAAPDLAGSARESPPMATGRNDKQGGQSVTGLTK